MKTLNHSAWMWFFGFFRYDSWILNRVRFFFRFSLTWRVFVKSIATARKANSVSFEQWSSNVSLLESLSVRFCLLFLLFKKLKQCLLWKKLLHSLRWTEDLNRIAHTANRRAHMTVRLLNNDVNEEKVLLYTVEVRRMVAICAADQQASEIAWKSMKKAWNSMLFNRALQQVRYTPYRTTEQYTDGNERTVAVHNPEWFTANENFSLHTSAKCKHFSVN